MIVKATPGRLVRDPQTMRPLPPEGLWSADDNLYWIRLREDGDVTITPDPVATTEEAGS